MSKIKDLLENLPKVEARDVRPDPLPTADNNAVANRAVSNSVVVQAKKPKPGVGRVEGYWSHESDTTLTRPDEVMFLAAGQTEVIPEGSAVKVLRGTYCQSDQWLKFECPFGAKLVGPMLWGYAEPASRHSLAVGLVEPQKNRAVFPLSLLGVFLFFVPTTVVGTVVDAKAGDGWALLATIGTFVVSLLTCLLASEVADGYFNRKVRRFLAAPQWEDRSQNRCDCPLPEQVADALAAPASPVQPATSQTREILKPYRAAFDRLMAGPVAIDRQAKALLEHGKREIEAVAHRIDQRPAVADAHEAVMDEFRQLVGRSLAEVERAHRKVAIEEGDSIMVDIRSLQAQLDQHLGLDVKEPAA